jgi:hypothetical protein
MRSPATASAKAWHPARSCRPLRRLANRIPGQPLPGTLQDTAIDGPLAALRAESATEITLMAPQCKQHQGRFALAN